MLTCPERLKERLPEHKPKTSSMKITTQILIITLPAAKSCMALLSLLE